MDVQVTLTIDILVVSVSDDNIASSVKHKSQVKKIEQVSRKVTMNNERRDWKLILMILFSRGKQKSPWRICQG